VLASATGDLKLPPRTSARARPGDRVVQEAAFGGSDARSFGWGLTLRLRFVVEGISALLSCSYGVLEAALPLCGGAQSGAHQHAP